MGGRPTRPTQPACPAACRRPCHARTYVCIHSMELPWLMLGPLPLLLHAVQGVGFPLQEVCAAVGKWRVEQPLPPVVEQALHNKKFARLDFDFTWFWPIRTIVLKAFDQQTGQLVNARTVGPLASNETNFVIFCQQLWDRGYIFDQTTIEMADTEFRIKADARLKGRVVPIIIDQLIQLALARMRMAVLGL